MVQALERTLEQLDIGRDSSYYSSDGYQSEDEIVCDYNDDYYLGLLDDNSSILGTPSQSSSGRSSPMAVDDRMVLHPVHSLYARRFPQYNVFGGQPLVNNGYVDVNDTAEVGVYQSGSSLRT